MWNVSGNALQMAEGDFGISLPIQISGTTLSAADVIRAVIKTAKNGETIISKDLTPSGNEVSLVFTEDESALFQPGNYTYSLDWYQNGSFMCNIIPAAAFKVVDKA